MVLKELDFISLLWESVGLSTLGGYGGLERTDF